MNPKVWQPFRTVVLAATFIAALAVAGKAVLSAKPEAAVAPANSPTTAVPLTGWQSVMSSPLPAIEGMLPGQKFEYRQAGRLLTVEARMMLGDGNVSRFLFVYTPIRAANANLVTKQQPGVGYYGLLTHQGKAYLSACVNVRGESTVTEQQFMQSRYAHDLQADRVLPWLLGQHPLFDQRCLWTLMSVPLPEAATTDAAATAAAYQSLETAWVSWHRWWQSNFPPT